MGAGARIATDPRHHILAKLAACGSHHGHGCRGLVRNSKWTQILKDEQFSTGFWTRFNDYNDELKPLRRCYEYKEVDDEVKKKIQYSNILSVCHAPDGISYFVLNACCRVCFGCLWTVPCSNKKRKS